MIGNYYRTISRDEATGDTLFLFSPTEPCPYVKDGLLSCRGNIRIYSQGIPLEITGDYQNSYFHVTDCKIAVDTREGSRKVLEYVADLTEPQIQRLLDACNGQVFELIGKPELLMEVLKRSKQKEKIVATILNRLKSMKTQEILSRKLMSYGIALDRIEALFRDGIDLHQMYKNPYLNCLYHEIPIYQADQFAYDEMHIRDYDERRLIGFLLDAMMLAKASGHTCQTPDEVCRLMNWRMKRSVYPETEVSPAILNYLVSQAKKLFEFHIINGKLYLYETSVWEEETKLLYGLQRLLKTPKPFLESVNVEEVERKLGITYTPEQRAAFSLLRYSGVKILTGPPGSGKTAMIRGLIEQVKMKTPGKVIQLSATTGRASQVLGNSCGSAAETVNKMLGVRPYGDSLLARNQSNPIEADLIIVDEVSMLGLKLASILVHAVRPGSILLLVGDDNQLQSVEYGNVLEDLIESDVVKVYRLTQIIRQSGRICENAMEVQQGKFHLKEGSDFHIHRCREEEVLPLLKQHLQDKDCQVISPVKGGPLGIRELNAYLQNQNRKGAFCLTYRGIHYHIGEPIIMTKTNYDKGYFNGDIGIITGKDDTGILVAFDRCVLHLDREDYHLMDLAYAITTHKVQGSEFAHIHIVLPRHPENMLTRRILYTAITRAKRDVHIYDVDGACHYAISNQAERPRRTLLIERLKREENQ